MREGTGDLEGALRGIDVILLGWQSREAGWLGVYKGLPTRIPVRAAIDSSLPTALALALKQPSLPYHPHYQPLGPFPR